MPIGIKKDSDNKKGVTDNLKIGVKDYNNLNDLNEKLILDRTKKQLELSKLSGTAAIEKQKEIDKLNSKIESNKAQLSTRESKIKEAQKSISDLNLPPADPIGPNLPAIPPPSINAEDFGGPALLEPPSLDFVTGVIPSEKKDLEVNALNNISDSSTIDNADLAGFQKSDNANASSLEVIEIRDAGKSLFSGLKSYDDQSILNERIKYYNSDNKTYGFIMPWDSRLGYAYTSTQSIGNHMPFGDEWVGSPAIMNPYALIRFEHVASSNHHKFLIDQKNNAGFKGTLYKPYANVGDFKDTITITKNEKKGEDSIVNFSNYQDKIDLGITEADGDTFSDDSGALYVNEIDYSQEVWKPKKVVEYKNRKYTLNDDPSEVTVDTPLAASNAEQNRKNAIIEMRKNHENGKNIKAAYGPTTTAKDVVNADTNKKTPLMPTFWIEKQGWIKCKDSSGKELYVEPQHCEGCCLKNGESEETIKQIQKDAESAREYIVLQMSRGWEKEGNAVKKRYLRKPNSKPVFKEILEPTTDNLTNPEHWTGFEQFQYRWADFLYCKYYDTIPNNYLITLRRYPMPVGDNAAVPDQIKTKQHLLPVASAITWMGAQTGNQISELMTFSYHMNWRDLKAEINEIGGNEQGASDSPFGEGVAKWLGMISGESNFNSVSGWDEQRAKFDPYKDGSYANRVYGPVNVIESTKARDRGLGFEHPININFHYSLKSIGGINPKAAMLDIMANILALTYNNAGFWGGANRYFPNKPAYPFLGGKKGMNSWYSGNATGFLDGLADQLSSALGNIGSFVQNLITNPREALKGLASKGTQLWMAEKQRDKRPAILGLKALLTGEAVGEWHLTIGNPFNPMMMIGNLICTSTRISFSDRISADDFPDEMVVAITLEHGRPRDKGDIESMFNRGSGRLHYSYYGKDSEFWNQASSTRDSNIDNPNSKTIKVDNNYTGKQENMTNVSSGGNYGGATSGGAVNNAWAGAAQLGVKMGKIYNSSNKQAVLLSEKIGFKSGGE